MKQFLTPGINSWANSYVSMSPRRNKQYLESHWTPLASIVFLYLDSDDEKNTFPTSNEIKILLNTANNSQRENVHNVLVLFATKRWISSVCLYLQRKIKITKILCDISWDFFRWKIWHIVSIFSSVWLNRSTRPEHPSKPHQNSFTILPFVHCSLALFSDVSPFSFEENEIQRKDTKSDAQNLQISISDKDARMFSFRNGIRGGLRWTVALEVARRSLWVCFGVLHFKSVW